MKCIREILVGGGSKLVKSNLWSKKISFRNFGRGVNYIKSNLHRSKISFNTGVT